MNGGDPSGALRDIRTLFSDGRLGGLTDRQLLERFVNRKDSSAEDGFTIILERHGPMVWGVCRRLLSDRDAAADAFQATFLVLVLMRRARAVRVDDSLGPWLYGVSRRVAARARAASLRRSARETGGVEAVAGPAPDPDRAERLAILDEEIGRLPERHRAAVVLCDLEGLPHEEAARRLGCPVGTVESRLSRGRQRLRDRLVRRGFAPAAAALWAEMARESSAAMPAALIKHAAQFVTSAPVAGAMPVAITALAKGVIRMMWLARLKRPVAVAAALILATVGVALQGRQQPHDATHKITVTTLQSKAVTLTQPYVCQFDFNVPEARYLEYKSANLDQHKDDLKIELVLANGNKFDQPGKLGAIKADFNNETGNVPFRADFPNPDRLLRHGQTGTLLISQVQNDAIVITQRATFEVRDKRYVYVVDKDDVAHQREIAIRNELEDGFVVKMGVGVDDKIVIEGIGLVRDGDKVEYEDRQPKKDVVNPK